MSPEKRGLTARVILKAGGLDHLPRPVQPPDGWDLLDVSKNSKNGCIILHLSSDELDQDLLVNQCLEELDSWLEGMPLADLEVFDQGSLEHLSGVDSWWEALGLKVVSSVEAFSAGSLGNTKGQRLKPIIVQDSVSAFGSGSHPSTISAACGLKHLAGHGWLQGRRVLDIGTGTGILAMAAARFGASKVDAVDIDHRAAQAASANIKASGLDSRIAVHCAPLERLNLNTPDVIVSNLTPSVLQEMLPAAAGLTAAGGFLIAAGFESASAARRQVIRALEGEGYFLIKEFQVAGWSSLLLKKGQGEHAG